MIVLVSKRTDQCHGPFVGLAREGDDYALDLIADDEIVEIVQSAEQRQLGDLRAHGARILVDESDELDPVFRVLLDLARDELADMAGTDHDAALHVHRQPADDRARDDATG